MTNLFKWVALVIGIVAVVFLLAGVIVSQIVNTVDELGGVYNITDQVFEDAVVNDALDVNGETTVQGFTQGGGAIDLVDATGGTYTLTEAELLASNYLKFSAGGSTQAVIALTLPATSTMTTLIKNPGDCREWVYDASALTAATTTTITAGTGHDVVAYTTNDDVIDGGEFAFIKMCRQGDTDVTTYTTEILNAD